MISYSVIYFFLAAVYVASVHTQTTCDNAVYDDLNAGLVGLAYCSYPAYKFTPECVLESCPELFDGNLCLTNDDGSFNTDNAQKIVHIVNSVCLNKTSICGADCNPIHVSGFEFGSGFLFGNALSATCKLLNNATEITNLYKTELSLDLENSSSSQLRLNIEFHSITGTGLLNCQLKLPVTLVAINNISFNIPVSFNAVAVLDLNNPYGIPKSEISDLNVVVKVPSFIAGQNINLDIALLNRVFTAAVKSYVENSSLLMTYTADFVAALTKQAIIGITQNCTLPKDTDEDNYYRNIGKGSERDSDFI
ncbi:hypothetical protein CHUAL_006519 [Chamberlinius hualienensis]